MTRVGVIGLGMMGGTHLDVYAKRDDVEIVAISDINPNRLSGEELAIGNIEGQAAGGFDIRGASVKRYDEGKKLIRSKQVDLVDVCLPTPLHVAYAKAALRAGKHVMVEKPVGRTYREARKLVDHAEQASTFTMVGMCMRFWPGWTWLKDAVDDGRYGKVRAAAFQRLSTHPGGPFYRDGEACGGALLDLHVHDTDFVYYLWGVPDRVSSTGYSTITGETDHLMTTYHYDSNGPALVTAEGGWSFADGYPFTMRYTVNFERATAVFDAGAADPLVVHQPDQPSQTVNLEPGMGYDHELAYFLDCIRSGRKPTTVTVADAIVGIKIAEAERKSVLTGRPVKIRR